MMQRLFLALTLTVTCAMGAAHAAPVVGKAMTLTQPNGDTIQALAWGDEFCRFFETTAGYTIVRCPETAEWQYAVLSADGTLLLASGLRVDAGDPAALLGVEKHLRITDDAERSRIRAGRSKARASSGREKWITTGERKGVTIIVNFPDETTAVTPAEIDDFLNGANYTGFDNSGSVRDYFKAMSENKLDFTNIVIGPFTAAHSKAHYDGMSLDAMEDLHPLVQEALEWARDVNGFDFSDCDADNDGYVDAVSLFYAGEMGQDGLWAHQGPLQFSANGKQTRTYQMSYIGSKLELYTFCHESVHMLTNALDLYDTTRASAGMGVFCLMAIPPDNEAWPQKICGYLRAALGWAQPVDITSTNGTYDLSAATGNLLIYRKSATEYFMLENRHQSGWDELIPDSGVAIYLCDANGSNDYAQGTATEHYECALIQADGRKDLETNENTGDDADLFDVTTGLFNSTTTPAAIWWDGSLSALSVTVTSPASQTMTVVIGDGTSQPASLAFVCADTGIIAGDVIQVSLTLTGTVPANCNLFAGFELNGTLFFLPAVNTTSAPYGTNVSAGSWELMNLLVDVPTAESLRGASALWLAALLNADQSLAAPLASMPMTFE